MKRCLAGRGSKEPHRSEKSLGNMAKWFPKLGLPQKWMVYKGKSQSKMDDDWGYPYFRKPPNSEKKYLNSMEEI